MTSRTTPRFRKALDELPPDVRRQAVEAFEQFQSDSAHPGLQFKQAHPSKAIYSARVTRGYRALAVRQREVWIWFWIGSHSDYEKLLRRV